MDAQRILERAPERHPVLVSRQPIGREREGEERTREEVRDFSAAGKNGFISSTYGMCVTALEYGDDQFFELAVTLLGAGHGTSSAACHCAMKLSSQVAEKV